MIDDRQKLLVVVSTGLHDLLAERGVTIRSNASSVMNDSRREVVAVLRELAPGTLRTDGVPALASALATRIGRDKYLAERIVAAAAGRLTGSRPAGDSTTPPRVQTSDSAR